MNARTTLLVAVASVGLYPAWGFAAPSTSEMLAACRAELAVVYGEDQQQLEVRLQGTRKSGRQLRLTVITPEHEVFHTLCTVNRKTGQVVAMEPPVGQGEGPVVTSRMVADRSAE